jgi:hypothetical protein
MAVAVLSGAAAVTLAAVVIPFLVEGVRSVRAECGYVESMSETTGQIEEYLHAYFKEHGRYPDELDLSRFKAYQNDEYRSILDRINYETDGSSFTVVWRRPSSSKSREQFLVWTCTGVNGKRTNFNTEFVHLDGDTQ